MKLNVISCCLFPLQSKAQCTLTDYKDCKTCTVPFITVLCKYLSQLNKWLDCIWLTPACSDWHPQKDTTQRAAIRTSYQYSDRLTSIPILFAFNPTDPLTTPLSPFSYKCEFCIASLLRSAAKVKAQCVNLWFQRRQSSCQGREASVKVDPQADSRHGCLKLSLISLNTEIKSCKMWQGGCFWEAGSTVTEESLIISSAGELYCKVASLAGWLIWVLKGGRSFLERWMVAVSRKAGRWVPRFSTGRDGSWQVRLG